MSKKIVLGYFRFCKKAVSKYLEKGISKINFARCFKIFVNMLFSIFEKRISKKIVLHFLKFSKYAFFKYLKKGISKKTVLGFLKFCKYAFLNI